MPKVFLTDGQRRTEHIKKVSRWTRGKFTECGFDQKDLANYICESESKSAGALPQTMHRCQWCLV